MSQSGRVYSEYDKKLQATPREVKKRVARNRARRQMLARLSKTYGKRRAKTIMKGKDVDHIKSLHSGGSGNISNTRLRSVKSNRGDKSY